MQKLQNNAVIEKCWDCRKCHLCYGDTGNIFTSEYENKIHKDCPLQSCEVIDDMSLVTLRYWKDGMLDLPDKESVDKIIIVYKSSHGKWC